MAARTAVKDSRKAKVRKAVDPEVLFRPVHAASMSTPIFAALECELGEPDLNPQEVEVPTFAQELIEFHAPDLSMKGFLPAWVQNTGQYLVDQSALELWRARMAQDDPDKGALDGQGPEVV